jgi:TorA maturation chaperone TorD
MRILGVEKETVDKSVQANRSRGIVYSFLSKVYEREVTVDFLKRITGNDFISQLSGVADEEGFKLLSSYLKSLVGRDPEKVKLELAVEYAALFLGLRGGIYHPSESAYRTSTHFIMQQPRDDVMMIYLKAGVSKADNFPEPEDHIAMELLFMAHLCGKTADALQGAQKDEARKLLETQEDFLNNHIMTWVPQFTQDVVKVAQLDFYKAVAEITNAFIATDKEAVAELIQELGRAQ